MTYGLLIVGLILIGLVFYIKARAIQNHKEFQAFCHNMIRDAENRAPSKTEPLHHLPDPIKRYLRTALGEHDDPVKHVRLKQVGMLQTRPFAKNWCPFSADQLISESPAAFVWDAKIKVVPGLHVRVRDSYAQGIGSGKVSLLSAFVLGRDENRPELNSGALFRFLAEAPWHPRVLWSHAGIKWEAIDAHHAVAHLTDAGISISLEFRINDRGEITSVFTKERFGLFGGKYEQHPWEGHFSDYQEFDGIRIPTKGEVGWHLPDGFWLCWKGDIVAADFSR